MGEEEVLILKTENWDEVMMPIVPKKRNVSIPIIPNSPEVKCCSSGCAFSRLEHCNLESLKRSKSAMKLGGLILFYTIAIVVEIIGGLRANSLAVMTDAVHLLSDVAGFAASLFAVWVSGWEATPQHSFGYNRLEVLGALVSVQLIWLISGVLIYQAINRILGQKTKVDGFLMFAIAAFGFILNLFMVIWLGHSHDSHSSHCCHHDHHSHSHQHHLDHESDHENEEIYTLTKQEGGSLASQGNSSTLDINIQGAYLHVITDMIQSIGVMIAGVILWFKPDWIVVDLICTLVFSVLSLATTFSMLRHTAGILMEGTPKEVNIEILENDLKNIKGVHDLHDLHIWSITVGKVVLSCHVVAEPGVCTRELILKIRNLCEKRYNIVHTTIQVE
ncbi:metal tolerance protein B [Benincasa hispida]|uniref:metal tolerance protein B n=1 Tax=Benincasa hispida TaxID=102211 RepID=UPI001900AD80|nr:metal tolerance protein B [Benincasa hispida]XP_038893888.1 metal tolerance protein B [Benincasa hispida]